MNNRILLFFGAILLLSYYGYGQSEWKLKTEKEGIAIYTRMPPDSKYKEVKVVCTVTSTLSQLVAVILDVNAGAEWLYSTKSAVLLKQVSPSELYYYSEVNVPWPVSNRDFIAHLKVVQDPNTKVVTVYGPTVPNYIPPKKDIVRVARSEGRWTITPVSPSQVKIEYSLQVDPGGSIPVWLTNLFATKGPYESFKNLKAHLRKPAYANVHLDFIKD